MNVFLASLSFVILAEMGDKTQLLAIAFTSRFKAQTVLSAVFVATLLNHALAVAAGRLLSTVTTVDVMSLLGGDGRGRQHRDHHRQCSDCVAASRRQFRGTVCARGSRAPQRFPGRVPQSLFAALLLAGWVASLGLAKPLAAFDHWITFVLLTALRWKMIHGIVRPRQTDRPFLQLDPRLIYAVLILAALTSAHAFRVEFRLSLAFVPAAVLLLGVAALLAAPILGRPRASKRLRRLGQHRLQIAGSLVPIGIALKTLTEHLA